MEPSILKEKIPAHLHPYLTIQDPSLYTAMDHANWRYIMRVSKAFFAERAHPKYLQGLEETGIPTDRIPLISEMDLKLQKFGWRAVAVVGFIPPAVFMEFLSLGVLPIACDMRRPDHLSYTPAPDIVHEAAGHAPIIADPEYADYLFQYGEIARKVIFSSQDMKSYEAIRRLSETKENPASTQQEIALREDEFNMVMISPSDVSEATELARMGWWTIEYGLVGDMDSPKIYGAGLLSSLGESYHCFERHVKKIPFSIECVKTSYDITKPQPQLYVTPDFQTLSRALEELASRMAFRRGGLYGLEKAKRAQTVTTTVLDSGVQISGRLAEFRIDKEGQPCFLKFEGASQLAHADLELPGHGPAYHAGGFSTPLGRLKGRDQSLSELSPEEIERLPGRLEFESGIVAEGRLKSTIFKEGRHLVLSFEHCTVRHEDEVLFHPSWGTFDLACGASVVSVYGGAADRQRYLASTGGYHQAPTEQKTNLRPEHVALNELYQRLREWREKGGDGGDVLLEGISKELDLQHPDDWLLRLELLEFKGPWEGRVREHLERLKGKSKDQAELIERGLRIS